MTDKKKVPDEKGNEVQATTTSEDDPGTTGPGGVDEPPSPKPAVYLFSGIAAGAAWLISPHVKELHHILWWILPFLFFLLGVFGYFKAKK